MIKLPEPIYTIQGTGPVYSEAQLKQAVLAALQESRRTTASIDTLNDVEQAIATMQAALAQPVQPSQAVEATNRKPGCTECSDWKKWQDARRFYDANLAEALAQPVQPSQAVEAWNPSTNQMTADRATYFMRRFKHEEKLLGPNEQAAIDYVIALLAKPSQARELSNAEIEALWQSLDGKSIITGENQLNWNRLVRMAFARAITSAINAKGAT